MNVSAIIVTRGDVDLEPILRSLPAAWEMIVWDNGDSRCAVWPGYEGAARWHEVSDLSVYGRYAAIKHASHDICFVQDDDCIVSDPQAIVDEWVRIDDFRHVQGKKLAWVEYADYVVCNMPQRFRHDFYDEHALVGFGAAFHRDAPERAFQRFLQAGVKYREEQDFWITRQDRLFHRTCDVVFTGLTPRVLVDVPYSDASYASDPGRMWTTPGHQEERSRMLDLVRRVRDAS
jgi:hypothetical protein